MLQMEVTSLHTAKNVPAWPDPFHCCNCTTRWKRSGKHFPCVLVQCPWEFRKGCNKTAFSECMQSVQTYASARCSLVEKIALGCEDQYRMGRFDEISHRCTDLLVAAVKVSRETI